MIRVAAFSEDGTFRYALWRTWDPVLPTVEWIMLNPSKADADVDDPTVRRCIGFSRRWGFGALRITNLFAFRTTYPRELRGAKDRIGPHNASYLARCEGPIVAAWGGSLPPDSDEEVSAIRARAIRQPGLWFCLGITNTSGQPRHPLMLPYSTPRVIWP